MRRGKTMTDEETDDSAAAEYAAAVCLKRLLELETPEDARKILDALEDDWYLDWAGAFDRAARKVLF